MPDGFRSQQRFHDSDTGPVGDTANGRHTQPPPEWTAVTPPTGFPQPAPPTWAPPATPPTSDDLTTAQLLRPLKAPPSRGWRKWLYLASFKTINVGESTRATQHNDLVAQANRPLQRPPRCCR